MTNAASPSRKRIRRRSPRSPGPAAPDRGRGGAGARPDSLPARGHDGRHALRILDEAALARGLEALRVCGGETIDRMLAVCGPPPLRRRHPGLPGLVWIVVSQQVSTASARAIFTRCETAFGGFEAAALAGADDEMLRACGLSRPKMRTLRALAGAVHEGHLDLDALPELAAEEAHARLTAIHGIGPWTADIWLLFCAGHADVWPAGDLALQEGVRLALGLRTRPDAKKLIRIAERWRPWRAVAARLIWAYYGVARPAAGKPAKKPAAGKPARATAKKKTGTSGQTAARPAATKKTAARKATAKKARKTPSGKSRQTSLQDGPQEQPSGTASMNRPRTRTRGARKRS